MLEAFGTTHDVASCDGVSTELLRIATNCQQDYYEISSDWNLYKKDEYSYLKGFIGYALYGPPCVNNNAMSNGNFIYNKDQTKNIYKVLKKVIEYGTMDEKEGQIECGLIYNVIYKTEDGYTKCNRDTSELLVYPVPVFKVKGWKILQEQKLKICNKESVAQDAEPNVWFIDNSARVYKGFSDYVTNNTLPQCIMVLPKDGKYQMSLVGLNPLDTDPDDDYNTLVWTEVHRSPASTTKAKIVQRGDMVNMVAGAASTAVSTLAMVTPIGGAMALATSLGFGASSLWTACRCLQQLLDRNQHDESIMDKASIGTWIGVVGGAFGIGAATAPILLSNAVRAGVSIGQAATMSYDAVLIGNLIVNGVGAGIRSYDIMMEYIKGEKVSPKEVALLTVHIFILCNSFINLNWADNLIETTHGQIIKDYDASLRSNRHRKEFQRIVRNTRAASKCSKSSDGEIIRGINMIHNKDDFFQAMVRNRKCFSAASARASFADGKVSINSRMTIDPVEFSELSKDVRINIIHSVSSEVSSIQCNPTKGNDTKNQLPYSNYTNAIGSRALKAICSKEDKVALPVVQISNFKNVLHEIQNIDNCSVIFMKLLGIGYCILEALPRNVKFTIGDILAVIVQFVWDCTKSTMKKISLPLRIDDPALRDHLFKSIGIIQSSVEKKTNDWVEKFIEWLKIEFPHFICEA